MFSSLKNVLKKDWYSNDENLLITLYTPDTITQYQVFSVYEIRAENYYATPFFSSDAMYVDFLNKIKSRSIHNFNVEVSIQFSHFLFYHNLFIIQIYDIKNYYFLLMK